MNPGVSDNRTLPEDGAGGIQQSRRRSLVVWACMLLVTCGALVAFTIVGQPGRMVHGGRVAGPLLAGLICAGLADAAFWFILSLPVRPRALGGVRYHNALLLAVSLYNLAVSAASGAGAYYAVPRSTGLLICVTAVYYLWRFPSLEHMLAVEDELRPGA